MLRYYQCRSGRYAGWYHLRRYQAGKYFHIGRFKTEEEVRAAMAVARDA